MTHEEAVRAGLAQIIDEYENPPPQGYLVPAGWIEDYFDEAMRGGWIEDLIEGNCLPIMPAGWVPESLRVPLAPPSVRRGSGAS
jgi:hypothetical protein